MSQLSKPNPPRIYPIEGDALPWDLILADPPARTPYSERFTSIEILSDGTVFLETNDLSLLRRFTKGGQGDWALVRIDGRRGRQTSWKFKGDESLISIRSRKMKRPGIAENLKKKEPEPPAPAPTGVKHDPALGWDELEEAIKRKQNQRIGANMPDPEPDPKSQWGVDFDF